ncbi:MAG TPA: MBL fold metallo-hydrolase [Blastocatellia bacterium]|nr:MBL fold metallo-hydrolase [Blastocatellia bacterium]
MPHQEPLYLRQNVQLEPLVDRWYAWPQLIPPVTVARNITERHLRILDSYIDAPQFHANAARNPKMLGGPFIDLQGEYVNEIRELRDRTKRERADLIELSAAITALDKMLSENAKGYSLHPLYPMVPKPLQGYVELFYDRNNRPSYRLIEPLLYRSKYYDRSLQSVMLRTLDRDDRPFMLTTPRLDSEGDLHLRLPFSHPGIDGLSRLKSSPRSWNEIKDLLEIESAQESLMRTFLTPEPPPPQSTYTGRGVRWRYFGHACILIEAQGISILVDPVLSYTYENGISRYTYLDLPDVIDYVLITHGHQDHMLSETMLQLRHKVKNIIVPRSGNGQIEDPSLKLLLNACGFTNVIELAEMEEIRDHRLCITGLPFFGEHADLGINAKLAWLVRIGGNSLMFLADSCNIENQIYEHIRRDIGKVDVLFIGMECDGAPLSWQYGPLMAQKLDRKQDESRRLSGSDCEQGMRIIDHFKFGEVYVYAMGLEPWLTYMSTLRFDERSRPIVESDKLIKQCREQGIVAERLYGEKEILLRSN